MRERKPLSLNEYYKLKLAIKFSVTQAKAGDLIYYQQTMVPGYHTPCLNIEPYIFRMYRKKMKLIGFIKSDRTIELFYKPRKITAA
jgi:hypothetical protein